MLFSLLSLRVLSVTDTAPAGLLRTSCWFVREGSIWQQSCDQVESDDGKKTKLQSRRWKGCLKSELAKSTLACDELQENVRCLQAADSWKASHSNRVMGLRTYLADDASKEPSHGCPTNKDLQHRRAQ